jgi:hypothetical protein
MGRSICGFPAPKPQTGLGRNVKILGLTLLFPSELAVWNHTERILEFVGGRPSRVSDIRISETMSSGTFSTSETLGLWDSANGWIIVKRSLLQSLEAYAGILLHEALHAKFALVDVSRDFEHYLTELCGKLAAEMIQEKEPF